MAVSDELLVSIKIDTKDGTVAVRDLTVAFKDLNPAAKGAGDAVDKSGKQSASSALKFTELNSTIELAKKAYNALVVPIEKVISAFLEQDKAETDLRNTLQGLGYDTQGALDDLKDFAAQLQATTGVGDETTLGLARIAKTMGLTNKQTKEIITTATGMANVIGGDVNDAFNGLIGQFNGIAGRQAKFVGGLKDLNEAQLKAGKGIELAAAQYAKFATLSGGSLTGAIKIAREGFGDLLEDSGKIISEFVNLPSIVKTMTEAFVEAGKMIRDFGQRLMVLKSGLQEINFDEVAASVRNLGIAFGAAFVALNFQAIVAGIISISKALFVVSVPAALVALKFTLIAAAVLGVVIAVETVVANLEQLPKLAETIKTAFQILFQWWMKAWLSIAEIALKAIKTILEPLSTFSDAAKTALGNVNKASEFLGKTIEGINERTEELKENLSDTASELNMGPTLSLVLKGVDAVKNAMADTAVEAEKTKKSFEDISKIKDFGPTPEQLKLIEQIRVENVQFANDLMNFGAEQIDVLERQFGIIFEQQMSRKKQLEIEGKLAGSGGKMILEGLEKQLGLQRAITDEKILQQAQNEIDQAGPIGDAAGTAALGVLKGFKAAIPLINKGLEKAGADFGIEFNAKAAAGFAVAFAKFFDSFEGFMEGAANIVGAGVQAAAMGLDKLLGTSFSEGAETFAKAFGAIASVVGTVFDQIVGVLKKIFDPKFIQDLADTIGNLVEQLPYLLMEAFESLADAMDKVIAKLPETIDRLMTSLSKITDRLLSQLPALIDSLADSLVIFLDRLPEITEKLFQALPGLIDKLLSRLPDVIDALLRAIPRIIVQLIQAVPGVIVAILENLPAILESLVSGIIGAMGEIVAGFIDFLLGGGLERIVVAFLKAIPRIVVAFVNGVVSGLKRAFGAIFGGIEAPEFFDKIGELPKKLDKSMKELGKSASREASKLFKVLDLDNAADGLKRATKVTDIIEDAATIVGKKITGVWMMLLDALKRLWQWIMEKILEPFMNALKAVWSFVYDRFLKPFIDGLMAVWNFINNNILQPFLNSLKAVWQFVYTNFIQPIGSIISSAWQGVYNFFNNIFKGKINDAFSGVISTLSNIGSAIWNGFKSGIDSAGALFANLGMSIYEGLKNGLSGLGSYILGIVNNLNPSNLLGKMFTWDGGGRGKVESALGIDVPFVSFATGGVVPGNPIVKGDSALNDRILALLSPGEYVVPRSIMNIPGAYDLIKAISEGKIDPQKFFSAGGVSVGGGSVSVGGVSVGSGGVTVGGKSPGEIFNDTISAIGDAGRPLGDRATDLGKALETGGKEAWEKAKEVGQDVWDTFAQLNPEKLWERVKEMVWDGVWQMVTHSAGRFHSGGLVGGYADGGDVMARLQPGEYVMSRGAVNSLGTGLMDKINSGNMGNVGQPIYNVDMKVNIEASSQSLDESFVRGRLIPAIKDEFKKSSLRGEFLISNKGVRVTS